MLEFEGVYLKWMKLKYQNYLKKFDSGDNEGIPVTKSRKFKNELREMNLQLDNVSMELVEKIKTGIRNRT